MENNNIIQQELMGVCPSIVQIEKSNLYSVSPSYFDQLPTEIMKKINTGTEPSYFFSHENPYAVPVGYFGSLSEEILKRVSQEKQTESEELEAIAPILNTIGKKSLYKVPDDYFDSLKIPTVEATIAQQPAKVVSGRSFAKLYKYAVAAAFIGVMLVGMFLFLQRDDEGLQKANPVTAEVKKLSDKDIEEFLKNTSAADDVTLTPATNKQEIDVKKSVSEMSDQEIQKFLKESGELDEM